MFHVAEYNGRISRIDDNLSDISVTSLEELGIRTEINDRVISMANSPNGVCFGTLGKHFFRLGNKESDNFDLNLGAQVRKIICKGDYNQVATTRHCYDIDHSGKIVRKLELPSQAAINVMLSEDKDLFAFFDKKIYELNNGLFREVKTLPFVPCSIVSTLEHYYIAGGTPNKNNGKLLICDKDFNDVRTIDYPSSYVLATQINDGKVLVSSSGKFEVFHNDEKLSSKVLAQTKNIKNIVIPNRDDFSAESQHYALFSAGNRLYSVDENLDVVVTKIFPESISCVR